MAYITEAQRYQIEVLFKQRFTISQIAKAIEHKYNTVYKEVKKGIVKQIDTNLKEYYVYKADYAHMKYLKSVSNRGRNLKIGSDYKLVSYIESMIKERKYSPEALLIQAKKDNLKFNTQICYKTIYNYIDKDLFLNLNVTDLPYKKKIKKKKTESKVSLNNIVCRSIDSRPKEISKRINYGHWEMDTVVSGQNNGKSCLLVLSERMTREEIIIKMKDKKASSTVHALNMLEKKLGSKKFREKFKTITVDNGVEFLNSEGIENSRYSKGKRTTLYYCHPYSSYERGTNENINRMIRRFFPKGTNFDMITKKQIEMVETWINNYPRKILGGVSSIDYKNTIKGLVA